jgi:tungstate transport system substrate-binding protein
MKTAKLITRLIFLVVLFAVSCRRQVVVPANPQVIRCAVIGGMTTTGLWQQLAKMFEAETGYQVEVVVTGPRPDLDAAMRAGQVDLLIMQSGDMAADLVADGYGLDMRPWVCNELCIVGPSDDPAHVRGMTNGIAALQKIEGAKAHFVDYEDVGSRELMRTLWGLSGIEPRSFWVLQYNSNSRSNALQYACTNDAYIVTGYVPAQVAQMPTNRMEILVNGDPVMRQPFVVMETNPKKFPQANYTGAKALSDFLISPRVQNFLIQFGTTNSSPGLLYFPMTQF